VLLFLKILPGYLQFRRLIHPLDLTWLVYAVLWFRIREKNETHSVS